MDIQEEGQLIIDREFDASERAKERAHDLKMKKIEKGSSGELLGTALIAAVVITAAMTISSMVTCNVADRSSSVELRECNVELHRAREMRDDMMRRVR